MRTMKYAHQLEIGDKVNGHEYGWMTVKEIEKQLHSVKVRYDTPFGSKEMCYLSNDEIEGIYTTDI